MTDDNQITEGMSRRTVLRLGVGAAAVATLGLSACERDLAQVAFPPSGQGMVAARGGWCVWPYQRAVMHPDGRLFVGAVRPVSRISSRIEVTSVDTVNLQPSETFPIARVDNRTPDDHWSPSLALIGNQVQVGWTRHDHDAEWLMVGTSLRQPLQRFDVPGASSVTYTQSLTTTGRRWVGYRDARRGWSIMSSVDRGTTWTHHGPIIANAEFERAYVAMASDGERLHLLVADAHASSRRTSIWHGILHPDLAVSDSFGTVVGTVGEAPAPPSALTLVRAGAMGADLAGDVTNRAIGLTMVDGQPSALISSREPGPTTDAPPNGQYWHRYHWARRDPSGTWSASPLAWAGSELSARSIDYVGKGALDPTSVDRLVISTDVHPVTGAPTGPSSRWNLWQGHRGVDGWSWEQLTHDNHRDHIRPVIATGGRHKALAWMRGRYTSYYDWDTDICVRRA